MPALAEPRTTGRVLLAAAAGLACVLAVPALAQGGATWVDKYGRLMTFSFPGDTQPPAMSDRSPADMAALFKTLCLDTGSDSASMGSAAAAAGLSVSPVHFPFGPKAPPINASAWSGSG